jgi:hypothetical protein
MSQPIEIEMSSASCAAVAMDNLPMMTTVLSSEAAFDDIEYDWQQLLDHSEQSVFFLRWHWNRLW